MRFIFNILASTQDTNKFSIGGSLCADADGKDKGLLLDMIDSMKEVNEKLQPNECISLGDDYIKLVDIPITACYNILSTYKSNLHADIHVTIAETAQFIPKNCEPIARMEVNRLFNEFM